MKENSIRILCLLTEAFGKSGGIALYNRDLLKALCEYPICERIVALPRLMGDFNENLPSKLIYLTQGINSKFQYSITFFKLLLKSEPFDIIICSHINLIPIAYMARILHRCPLLLIIYGIEGWVPPKNKILQWLVKRIDAYVSISAITQRRFLRWTGLRRAKGFILPNAIHLGLYSSGPKNPSLVYRYGVEGKTVLMTLCRLNSLERYKGVDEIIELLPYLAIEVPDIVYMIIGEGDDRKRLEEKTRNLGVADRVIFTGYIPEDEKTDHYRLADAFAMPGKGEGFGFVFLEAMACGIPSVASIRDGSYEAVLHGRIGIVVDPLDINSIKTGIIKALSQPKSVPDALDYFSFHNFTKRLHGIIDRVSQIKKRRL